MDWPSGVQHVLKDGIEFEHGARAAEKLAERLNLINPEINGRLTRGGVGSEAPPITRPGGQLKVVPGTLDGLGCRPEICRRKAEPLAAKRDLQLLAARTADHAAVRGLEERRIGVSHVVSLLL